MKASSITRVNVRHVDVLEIAAEAGILIDVCPVTKVVSVSLRRGVLIEMPIREHRSPKVVSIRPEPAPIDSVNV